MAAPAVPWIGSRISLISKSEIRYEGTLYTINAAESTVALENGDPPALLPPNPPGPSCGLARFTTPSQSLPC